MSPRLDGGAMGYRTGRNSASVLFTRCSSTANTIPDSSRSVAASLSMRSALAYRVTALGFGGIIVYACRASFPEPSCTVETASSYGLNVQAHLTLGRLPLSPKKLS
jgi:hypothetical protein